MKHKLAMKRFSSMLSDTDIVFVEAGRNLHLEHSTVTFADAVTTLKRNGMPSRSFSYDKLNLDRLYALAVQEPEKKTVKTKSNDKITKSKNYLPLITSVCVVTAVAITVIFTDVNLPDLKVNEKTYYHFRNKQQEINKLVYKYKHDLTPQSLTKLIIQIPSKPTKKFIKHDFKQGTMLSNNMAQISHITGQSILYAMTFDYKIKAFASETGTIEEILNRMISAIAPMYPDGVFLKNCNGNYLITDDLELAQLCDKYKTNFIG